MRATARANVAIYIVDPIQGSRNTSLAPAPPYNQNQARWSDGLREFASYTGGFAITHVNELSQLGRVVEDVSAYYFLDYVSSDQKADGKFRDLRVEVTRPGVKVRTRLGYVAPKP